MEDRRHVSQRDSGEQADRAFITAGGADEEGALIAQARDHRSGCTQETGNEGRRDEIDRDIHQERGGDADG